MNLCKVLVHLQGLLEEPGFDSPLNSEASTLYKTKGLEGFVAYARKFTLEHAKDY